MSIGVEKVSFRRRICFPEPMVDGRGTAGLRLLAKPFRKQKLALIVRQALGGPVVARASA